MRLRHRDRINLVHFQTILTIKLAKVSKTIKTQVPLAIPKLHKAILYIPIEHRVLHKKGLVFCNPLNHPSTKGCKGRDQTIKKAMQLD